jgi:hypothetical protein
LALFAVGSLCGCTKQDGSNAIQTAPPAPDAPKPATPPAIAPKIEGPVGPLLDTYEKLRAALAADDVATALTTAQPLADAGKAASAIATDVNKAHWATVADMAGKLAAQKPDLKGARVVFADISKAVVSALVADPALRQGRFIFECPMAPNYKRWVQTTSSLRNPYWGSEMLECGSQVDWAV